jgi:hypothetical protein
MLFAQFCFLRPKSTPRRLEVQKFFIHTKIIHIFCCAPEINSLRGWHVNVSSAQIEQIHISPDDNFNLVRHTFIPRKKHLLCKNTIDSLPPLWWSKKKNYNTGSPI